MAWLSFDTPIGRCAIAWEGGQVTGFRLPADGNRVDPGLGPAVAPEWIQAIVRRVQAHLGGRQEDFADLPFAWGQVSAFQQAVLRATLAIESGRTRSYGQIAAALSLGPEGARSVGAALGANPWPLIVPCHRVVAADGRMTGFSGPGGVRTKTRLLALEGAELLSE